MENEPKLELEALTVRFRSGFKVGPITRVFEPGIHWLRGANGCGKTTILEAIASIRRPTSGKVRIHGIDPWTHPEARGCVGYVSASASLPEAMTVKEAWQFGAAMRGASDWRGDGLVDELGLDPKLMIGHASAGQRRRAELVAALAGDPPILLLDEVFSYLDGAGVSWLRDRLVSWRERRVVLMTAHHDLGVPHDTMYNFGEKS